MNFLNLRSIPECGKKNPSNKILYFNSSPEFSAMDKKVFAVKKCLWSVDFNIFL